MRNLIRVIVTVSAIGVGVGYMFGGLIALGIVSAPFVVVQVYIGTLSIPWIGVILTVRYTFGQDLPSKLVRDAPFWSKAVGGAVMALSFVTLVGVPVSGGTLRITNWLETAPGMQAVMFVVPATMWYLPIPCVLAIWRRKQLGPADTCSSERGVAC